MPLMDDRNEAKVRGAERGRRLNILSLKTVRRDEPSLIEEFRREAAYRWAETSGLPPWTTRCTIGC